MSQSLGLPVRRGKKVSLTALIDVVFILLMFFMITSSFSQWRSLKLDSSGAAGTRATSVQEVQPLLVLKPSNALTLNLGSRVFEWADPSDALASNLVALLHETDQPAVLIPEPQVEVQSIVELIARLEARQVSGLTLGDALPQPKGAEQ